MGAWYQSILIRTEDCPLVQRLLREISGEKDVKFLVGPPVRGWISIFPSELGGTGEALAQGIGCDLFHFHVHDDDVFTYEFFRGGKLVDRYNSCPAYFDGEEGEGPPENAEETIGRPELFQELLPDPNELAKLKNILSRDRDELFAGQRMSDFVELLGLENCLSSYEYLQGGETDGIEGWDQFIHIEEQLESAEDFCRRAARKREAQHYPSALEDLNKALTLKPDMLDGYIARARVYEDLWIVVRAIQQQLDSRGSSGHMPRTLGESDLGTEQGNLEASLKDYERAVAQAPDNVDALIGRARLRRRFRDIDGAIKDYNRIIELRPEIPDTWSHRGQAKRKTGDLNGAVSDYNRAIELDPGNASFYNNRGLVRQKLGDLPGSLADLSRAIELNPELAAAHFNRACTKQKQNDATGALADLDRAISLKPDSAHFYQTRATLRRANGDAAGAIEDNTKAINLEPGFAQAVAFGKQSGVNPARVYASRAEAHKSMGNYDAAIEDCNMALKIDQDMLEAHFIRGEARRAKGDLDSAIADFDGAAKLKPDSAMIYNARGLARQAKGDLAGAIEDFKRACELKPDWASAHENLQAALRIGSQ